MEESYQMRRNLTDIRENTKRKTRKNRQLIYLFLFLVAVAGIFFFEKERSMEYNPDMNTKYVNTMLQGMEKILNKIPLDTIEAEKEISDENINRLLEGTERVLSGYIEMKAIGLEFNLYEQEETMTEYIFEQVSAAFFQLKDRKERRLSDEELASIRAYFTYLYDIYLIDLYDKELPYILIEMEKVSKNHEAVAEMAF